MRLDSVLPLSFVLAAALHGAVIAVLPSAPPADERAPSAETQVTLEAVEFETAPAAIVLNPRPAPAVTSATATSATTTNRRAAASTGASANQDTAPDLAASTDADGFFASRAATLGLGAMRNRGGHDFGTPTGSGNSDFGGALAHGPLLASGLESCSDLLVPETFGDSRAALVAVEVSSSGKVRFKELMTPGGTPSLARASAACVRRMHFSPAVDEYGQATAGVAVLRLRPLLRS